MLEHDDQEGVSRRKMVRSEGSSILEVCERSSAESASEQSGAENQGKARR